MEMRATYRRHGPHGWEGVVKNAAGTITAACGHHHRNRDTGRDAAMTCARRLLFDIAPDQHQPAGGSQWWKD